MNLYEKEVDLLTTLFADIDGNKRVLVSGLIENAAWIKVQLDELQQIINKEGCVVEYQHGKDQGGKTQSPEVKTYIALSKNYVSMINVLLNLVPMERRKDAKLAAFANVPVGRAGTGRDGQGLASVKK